jgi:hypothetical protein
MNALNNNNDDNTNKKENEMDEEKERRNFLFSGGGGGGGGGGSLASRLLKSGGNRDNTTKFAGGGGVGNIRGSGALGNANVVDKAMLAKQKLVKRARAELPPEDFPKFVEVMKSAVSADSSDVALHESMKTLAKLCKIEKRGVGPSTLWAAIGTSLALKDAAKKAYDGFEENAKRKMAEKTTTTAAATAVTIPPLVQSSQPPPPPKPKIDAGVENIFGRLARPPKEDSISGELKSILTTKPSSSSQAPQKAAKKKTSCDHCKASKCDRPFQSIVCGHFACYKCFNAVFAKSSAEAKKAPNNNKNNTISSSSLSGPCPTCSALVTKKSLKKMYL